MINKLKILLTLTLITSLCVYFVNNDNIYAKETKITIMLDAGHGGYDAGSIAYDGTYEKDYNLKIAKKLGKVLTEKGYNVVYTRTSDSVSWPDDNLKDLQTRCKLAKKENADYFISIHLNASDYDDGAFGYEIYCDAQNKKTTKLSKSILKSLDALNYSTNRGLLDTNETPLYVVSHNNVPSILIEAGFITDSSDLDYIKYNTDSLAQAIATGIQKSLA